MGKKYRSRTQIIAKLLEIANRENGVGITKLMYTSFLSYRQLRAYLTVLMKDNLLQYDKVDRFYRVTTKGKRFLGIFDEMNEMLNPFS